MLLAINGGHVVGCQWRQGDIVHFETTIQNVTALGKFKVAQAQKAMSQKLAEAKRRIAGMKKLSAGAKAALLKRFDTAQKAGARVAAGVQKRAQLVKKGAAKAMAAASASARRARRRPRRCARSCADRWSPYRSASPG